MANKCGICGRFAKKENLKALPTEVAQLLSEELESCTKCSEKSNEEMIQILVLKGKIVNINNNVNTEEEEVRMNDMENMENEVMDVETTEVNEEVTNEVENEVSENSVEETTEETTGEEINEEVTQETTDVAEATQTEEKVDTTSEEEVDIEDIIKGGKKGVTNFQMIPVLKQAVDNGEVDKILVLKQTFPSVFESTTKYIGAKRRAKIETMVG